MGEIDKEKTLNQWTYETRLVHKDSINLDQTSIDDSKRYFEEEMNRFAGLLSNLGRKLIIFGEVPPLGATPTGCERLRYFLSDFCSKDYFERTTIIDLVSYTNRFFESLENKFPETVTYINTSSSFCNSNGSYCLQFIDGDLIYRDDNHLNTNFLRSSESFFNSMKDLSSNIFTALEN